MDVSLWILIFQTLGNLDSSTVHGMGCLGSVPYWMNISVWCFCLLNTQNDDFWRVLCHPLLGSFSNPTLPSKDHAFKVYFALFFPVSSSFRCLVFFSSFLFYVPLFLPVSLVLSVDHGLISRGPGIIKIIHWSEAEVAKQNQTTKLICICRSQGGKKKPLLLNHVG